jgi:hypothetical protein
MYKNCYALHKRTLHYSLIDQLGSVLFMFVRFVPIFRFAVLIIANVVLYVLTQRAISELLQRICLSTSSHSSLHPLGCAVCLTRLSNLTSLLVYVHNNSNMSAIEVLSLVYVFNFPCLSVTMLRVLILK